jgi:hypothetical protein
MRTIDPGQGRPEIAAGIDLVTVMDEHTAVNLLAVCISMGE